MSSTDDRVEIARCPSCGRLPRPTLMGRTICGSCGIDVPQPPSPEVVRQAEALLGNKSAEQRAAELDQQGLRECSCKRGHHYTQTVLEFQTYKGALPMPCPICVREGLSP